MQSSNYRIRYIQVHRRSSGGTQVGIRSEVEDKNEWAGFEMHLEND